MAQAAGERDPRSAREPRSNVVPLRPAPQPDTEPAAEPQPQYPKLREWPITLVLAGIAASLVIVGVDQFRRGSVLLAGSILMAFFLRMFLDEQQAGLLRVRRRPVDLMVLGGLALGVTVFAFWVPAPN